MGEGFEWAIGHAAYNVRPTMPPCPLRDPLFSRQCQSASLATHLKFLRFPKRSPQTESNRQPPAYGAGALPVELYGRNDRPNPSLAGAAGRNRTANPRLTGAPLSQLSYGPRQAALIATCEFLSGLGGRIRTCDTPVPSRELWPS